MKTKIALAACFCALQGCTDDVVVAECAPVDAAPAASSAAIASALASIKEKYKLNAIIVGAEQDGRPLVRTALGISTNGVPATTDMHFRIGGVGWQMLAMVLLRVLDRTAPNIDAFFISVMRYCRSQGIDTSGSMVMSSFGKVESQPVDAKR